MIIASVRASSLSSKHQHRYQYKYSSNYSQIVVLRVLMSLPVLLSSLSPSRTFVHCFCPASTTVVTRTRSTALGTPTYNNVRQSLLIRKNNYHGSQSQIQQKKFNYHSQRQQNVFDSSPSRPGASSALLCSTGLPAQRSKMDTISSFFANTPSRLSSTRQMMKVTATEEESEREKLREKGVANENNDGDNLISMMRKTYEEKETDGIIQIAAILKQILIDTSRDLGRKRDEGMVFIESALEAVDYNKGKAAGIINGFIASCSDCPDLAWDVYSAWDESADELGFFPDLVTFCCTYTTMISAASSSTSTTSTGDVMEEFYHECALQVLTKAERYSKKLAGSKRRKLLVALSRRKNRGNSELSNVLFSTDKSRDDEKMNLEFMKQTYGEDFDVLFEDEDCIVVSKPSGMVCYHGQKTADGKIRKKKRKGKNKKKANKSQQGDTDDHDNVTTGADISLEDALLDIGVPLSTLNPDAMGIVHRIDRGTSGCIILAKNNRAHAILVTGFFTRNVKKSYTAMVPFHQDSSTNSFDELDTELQKSGQISDDIGGRPALSQFTVVKSYGTKALQLKVETKTGRKHQVRVHCAQSLGRPIFLDPIYSSSHHTNVKNERKNSIGRKGESMQQNQGREVDGGTHIQITKEIDQMVGGQYPAGHRFFLHASSLAIDEFSINIDVSSDVPQWWKPVLSNL